MKQVLLIGLAALGLSGCEATNPGARLVNLAVTGTLQTPSEARAINNAYDDGQCQGYGAQPGTDAYTNCRLQLAQMRQQRRIAASQAADASLSAMMATNQAQLQATMAASQAAAAAPVPDLLAGRQHCTTTLYGLQAQTNCR
jgi:hypothetical protein